MFTKRRSLKRAGKSGTLVFGVGLLAAFVMMLAALWPVPRVQAATTVINVCGQNTTNGWNLLSSQMSYLRAKLDNPANFGPAGTYGDFDFNYVDVGNNFTEAILAGNSCNIWFSGFEGDSTYTPTELTELQNWVTNHNGQVFAGCDASSYDPVCDLLDFSVTNDTDSYGFVVQQLVNPITCDGVLTPDDTLEMAGGAGAYFVGPGVTLTNVLAVHETGGVADPAKPIIIYTGAFFMTSDIDMVSIYTLTSGGGVTNNNDIMAVNAFSALADVSIGNDICSSAGPQTADLTITKATNPAGGTDFPFVLNPNNYHFLAKWGSPGTGNGQFTSPYGVAVGGNGNVYVGDATNNRIQKFAANGTYLAEWGSLGGGDGQFNTPYGLAIDGAGNVYVADAANYRIQKFDGNGAYLTQWGSFGSGDGQFINPAGVAVDGAGNVYVIDTNNHRIQKFDSNGTYLTQWGGNGSGDGQFAYPYGVAVDGAGNVYVGDTNNHRIQKFAGNGAYLTQWGGNGSGDGQFAFPFGMAIDGAGNVYVADNSNNRIQKFDAGGTYLTQWGSNGGGDGQFYSPTGVAVDGAGNVYVVDTFNYRVQKFGPDGATLDDGQSHTFSDLAAGLHEVAELVPDGWTLDDIDCGNATATRDGDTISVTLAAGDEVECTFTNSLIPVGGTITVTKQAGDVGDQFEFDPSWSDDNFLLYSGGGETSAPLPAGTYSVSEVMSTGWSLESATCDNRATQPVETIDPASIPVADGDDWLCTFTNVYDPTGSITVAKETNPDGGTGFTFTLEPDTHPFITKWGSNGSGDGQFDRSFGLAIDGSGNVYAADHMNHRIQKFDADGSYLTQWGGNGTGNGQLNYPSDVAVDGTGNVYVSDYGNNRIQKFDAAGNFLLAWGWDVVVGGPTDFELCTPADTCKDGTYGDGQGQFYGPYSLAVDGAGNVYVADTYNNRIQKFDGNGNYLAEWGVFGYEGGQFYWPYGVEVDGSGNIYVSDTYNHRVQKLDATGNFLLAWGWDVVVGGPTDFELCTPADTCKEGVAGGGQGQFSYNGLLATDGFGNVFVTDINNRIQKFDGNGAYLTQWGSSGDANSQFAYPYGVAVDGSNYVYVSDTYNHRIQKFGLPSVVLDDDQSHTFSGLIAGNYTLSEIDLPAGWTLDSATCDNRVTQPVETIAPSAIPLAVGDDWLCTFTNVYAPPPTNICPVGEASALYTDIIGKGMGNTKKHKNQVKLTIPNYAQVDSLYGQLVAKNVGNANYVRFILPGKNNWVQVNAITGPADMPGGNFWYGDYIDPAKTVTGRWFLQKNGAKNHIPRALVLYPTYRSATNTWVNIWNTYTPAEGEVYWDTANGWTPEQVIVESIAPPNGPTTFNVELAVADNDKDARPIWVTVEAGGVTQTQMPNNPSHADQLNLMTFTLPNVPAGTDEITITIYSPSMAADGVVGDSATLVGMAANYMCAPLN